jgi:hypothetical protein
MNAITSAIPLPESQVLDGARAAMNAKNDSANFPGFSKNSVCRHRRFRVCGALIALLPAEQEKSPDPVYPVAGDLSARALSSGFG